MRIAIGLKAHSGWAALVALGTRDSDLELIDRRRLELVEPENIAWGKQPYHAAEGLPPDAARRIVARAAETAKSMATKEIRAAIERAHAAGHDIAGVAVLVGTPMPDWTTEQILSVHIRMHKAEGALFPRVLLQAARSCGLWTIAILEKDLAIRARQSLPMTAIPALNGLGARIGPPWGKDQKAAAMAALLTLTEPLEPSVAESSPFFDPQTRLSPKE